MTFQDLVKSHDWSYLIVDRKKFEETVADVFNTLTEKQKTVIYALIGQALKESGNDALPEESKSYVFPRDLWELDEQSNLAYLIFSTLSPEEKARINDLNSKIGCASVWEYFSIWLNGVRTFMRLKELDEKDPAIKNVIFHDPATIVYWDDGTKTVVKAKNEPFDPEKGLAMALAKKALGNEGNYSNVFRHWLPKEEAKAPNMAEATQNCIDAFNQFALLIDGLEEPRCETEENNV